MKFTPRYYQHQAHDAGMIWMRKNTAPSIIEAATGAGKSLIISMLSESFYDLSGKHVLCTAPSGELVKQNYEKYLATGNQASIFSASLGIKSLRHPVVFGTPLSILNAISKFGKKFGLIIMDECEGITPTIRSIIKAMRQENDKLRELGLTATPYRTGSGLIYAMDENNKPSRAEECRDPYFVKKIFTIRARQLINEGYLTAPVIGSIHGDHYDTMNMKLNSMGKFFPADIDRAFVGHNRKTSRIVEDVIAQSQYRHGVMIFAATVQHAQEIMASLPPQLSRMIGGKINTGTNERRRFVEDFKAKKYKYQVSVGTMTVGVDFTHVDVIVFMRSMESIRLMQQIAGRGSRVEYAAGYPLDTVEERLYAIASGPKKDFLILDYGQNFERHCPDGDLYKPQIKASKGKSSETTITAKCELCETDNEFSARSNPDGLGYDENGYHTDLNGVRIETEYGPMSAHYGRRCTALHRQSDGRFVQCEGRWTFKNCPHCNAECDISARHCHVCKGEIVDPNKFLIDEFRKMKKDPSKIQCDAVISWNIKKTINSKGNDCLIVNYVTENRAFNVWYTVRSEEKWKIKSYEAFIKATKGGDIMPTSITYKKNDNGFYNIYAYGQEPDHL